MKVAAASNRRSVHDLGRIAPALSGRPGSASCASGSLLEVLVAAEQVAPLVSCFVAFSSPSLSCDCSELAMLGGHSFWQILSAAIVALCWTAFY